MKSVDKKVKDLFAWMESASQIKINLDLGTRCLQQQQKTFPLLQLQLFQQKFGVSWKYKLGNFIVEDTLLDE